MANLTFTLNATDGRARRGTVTTPRGTIETPVFMPVGTAGSVKGLWPRDLREVGTQISLANTYHLHIQPGESLIQKAGGLHSFMAMEWPLLTDSGGFQVFSLPKKEITEEGVQFQFKKDAEPIFASPEWSMEAQMALGADIVMAFDECAPYPCTDQYAENSMERTLRWLDRSAEAMTNLDQNLFGIVQGSVFSDLRRRSAEATAERDLPGYAVGGVSVGEGHPLMMKAVDDTEPYLPTAKPRYLMGVGLPEDIVGAVGRGMDMFDCVIPTRYGRSGTCFTSLGRIRVTDRRYRNDMYPLDRECACPTCAQYSRAYLHHLLKTGELLGTMACTLHNLAYYHRLMAQIREAIEAQRYEAFCAAFESTYIRNDRERRRERFVPGWFQTFEIGGAERLEHVASKSAQTRDSAAIGDESERKPARRKETAGGDKDAGAGRRGRDRNQERGGRGSQKRDGQSPQKRDGQGPQKRDGQSPQKRDGQSPQKRDGQGPQKRDGQGPHKRYKKHR